MTSNQLNSPFHFEIFFSFKNVLVCPIGPFSIFLQVLGIPQWSLKLFTSSILDDNWPRASFCHRHRKPPASGAILKIEMNHRNSLECDWLLSVSIGTNHSPDIRHCFRFFYLYYPRCQGSNVLWCNVGNSVSEPHK